MDTKQISDLSKKICSAIDWNRIHYVMSFLDWKWWDAAKGVPNYDELYIQAVKLSEQALIYCYTNDEPSYTISTGGISVKATVHDGVPFLRVSFELDSWDNYG